MARVLGQEVLVPVAHLVHGQRDPVVPALVDLQVAAAQVVEAVVLVTQVAELPAHRVLQVEPQQAAVDLPVAAQAAALQQVLSASPAVGHLVGASRSGRSVKNSTTWRRHHLQACGCSAVQVKRFDCLEVPA